MPAFAAHYFFARRIQKNICDIDRDLKLCPKVFYLGAQGPDFLFYHKLWRTVWQGKNLNRLGSRLHSCAPSELFAAMREYADKNPGHKDIIKSYAYGFLCHYSLDRFAHPLIYGIQEKVTLEGGFQKCIPFSVHALIETNIDAEILNRSGYKDGRLFNAAETIACSKSEKQVLAALMADAVPKAADTSAGEKDFYTAFSHMQLCEKLLYDPRGIKFRLLRAGGFQIRKKLGPVVTSMFRPEKNDGKWDYLNLCHTPMPMPADKTKLISSSFFELEEEAFSDALRLAKAFGAADAESAIRAVCKDMTFDTGLPAQRKNKKQTQI